MIAPTDYPLRLVTRLSCALVLCSSLLAGCGRTDEATAELSAHAEVAPEEMSDEELVAAGYERTPFGFIHRSCIYEIEDDAAIDATTDAVTFADGSTMSPPACEFPSVRQTAQHDQALAATDEVDSALAAAVANGWVEFANWTMSTFINHVMAQWHVPDYPRITSGQLLYFFPGTQPSRNGGPIYQPVLSYNYAGSGRYEIASWYVGANAYRTKLLPVLSGAGIIGTIDGSNCSSAGTCTYKIVTNAWTENKTATLTVTGGTAQYWAAIALEVYGVTSCDMMPANGTIQFYKIQLRHNANVATPSWAKSFDKALPGCSRRIRVGSTTTVNLDWY